MAITSEAETQRPAVLRQIAELQRLPISELMARWRVLMGTDPPSYNRPFLLKRLIYRIQELAYGGLPMHAYQEMDRVLSETGFDELGAAILPSQAHRPPPARNPGHPIIGTRLVREWNGRQYEVLTTREGFEFEGRPYKSLTAITKAITGTHWNGPRFFGLRGQDTGGDV